MSNVSELQKECKRLEVESRAARAKLRAAKKALIFEPNNIPYQEYLSTEHWRKVRLKALRRAGNKCQLCNRSDGQLHVHHRTYERRGKEKASDVIVLCKDCHEKHHGRERT